MSLRLKRWCCLKHYYMWSVGFKAKALRRQRRRPLEGISPLKTKVLGRQRPSNCSKPKALRRQRRFEGKGSSKAKEKALRRQRRKPFEGKGPWNVKALRRRMHRLFKGNGPLKAKTLRRHRQRSWEGNGPLNTKRPLEVKTFEGKGSSKEKTRRKGLSSVKARYLDRKGRSIAKVIRTQRPLEGKVSIVRLYSFPNQTSKHPAYSRSLESC